VLLPKLRNSRPYIMNPPFNSPLSWNTFHNTLAENCPQQKRMHSLKCWLVPLNNILSKIGCSCICKLILIFQHFGMVPTPQNMIIWCCHFNARQTNWFDQNGLRLWLFYLQFWNKTEISFDFIIPIKRHESQKSQFHVQLWSRFLFTALFFQRFLSSFRI
jgi:hypothetical protein